MTEHNHEAINWKCGNEFAPFHPSASHIRPDYRDGWNACYETARADRDRLEAEVEALRNTAAQIAEDAAIKYSQGYAVNFKTLFATTQEKKNHG